MSADTDGPPGRPPERGGFLDGEELTAVRSGVVSFVRETVEQAGAEGVVVGLSGGVDSTLSAVLAVEALGADRVLGLSMPCHKTDRPDANEARTIAEGLGVEFAEVSVRSLFERFEEAVRDPLAAGGGDRTTAGNAVARLRMLCLYYAANARSRLVLGTANRTELLTGYFTKYGDGGADLFPLGGLYKTEVRALARRAGVPRRIVAKPSTAGFWAGQTDVDELGAEYETVDALLHRVFDEGARVDPAVADLPIDRAEARDVLARCADTAHKRRTPPVYGISDRPPAGERRRTPAAGRDCLPDLDPPGDERAGGTGRRPSARGAPGADFAAALDEHGGEGGRDALFGALGDDRRRTVLDVLYARGEEVALSELVPTVVGRDTDQPPEAAPSAYHEQVATALVHVHLPHLAGAALIDYDRERRTVALTRYAERLRPVVAPLLA